MMKKTILIILALCTISISAQEKENNGNVLDRKHELRLSAVKLLAAGIFETSYEYIQDSNRGFGISLLVNLDSDKNNYLENYSLTPYYRMYFQTNEDYGAKGFFAEGFTSFFGGDNENSSSSIVEDEKFFDISIGLAIGKKWINTAGFVFEAKLGAGRNILGNSTDEFLFKGDLSIGYRF